MENRDTGMREGFGDSRGLWDGDSGWRGGGEVGVNTVMISPEFPSSGPLKRERQREKREERAAAVLSPPATLTMATPPSSRERGTLRENRNPDTHTH